MRVLLDIIIIRSLSFLFTNNGRVDGKKVFKVVLRVKANGFILISVHQTPLKPLPNVGTIGGTEESLNNLNKFNKTSKKFIKDKSPYAFTLDSAALDISWPHFSSIRWVMRVHSWKKRMWNSQTLRKASMSFCGSISLWPTSQLGPLYWGGGENGHSCSLFLTSTLF